VAASLGADVPFCLVGGRARVTGIGDVVQPLELVERTFTLLTPPFGVSTPAVYRAWDELGGPTTDGPNDLEPAALVVEPRLVEWRDRLADATGKRPVLAGSGSTWFVEGAHPGGDRVVTRTDRPT
jgi:4-diphosphocytidyl-2-C-methyl-D-erythritol kinase